MGQYGRLRAWKRFQSCKPCAGAGRGKDAFALKRGMDSGAAPNFFLDGGFFDMTDKEFKHLNRSDLVEIIYELQKNEQQLRTELEALQTQLSSREIKIAQAGSIAEAAVGLNNVFETAQAAADQYLDQIHSMNADTEKRCADLLEEARQNAAALKQQTDDEIREKLTRTEQEISEKWAAFQQKTEQILQAHSELSELLKR